jgi:hypothetical protein
MTFNRIQLLRNSPIKVARDQIEDFIYVQGPTIANIYSDEIYFFSLQLITMPMNDLMAFLKVTNEKLSRIEIINIVLEEAQEKEKVLESFKKIIINCDFIDGFLQHGNKEISEEEIRKISRLLKIIMGQEKYEDYDGNDSKELTDMEKRQIELDERIRKKKESQKKESVVDEKNVLEDIIIAITYEFGFKLEDIMNMNYFTLLWYYSYTGKIHIYRFNQFALSSGAVKKINADYFTSLK